ncbi:hypothetical protein B0H11DRAFT_1719455, partial [Mycena galericulata]
KRREWRLCKFDEAENCFSEMVVRLQGILVQADLVPDANSLTRTRPNKVLYLSQRAMLAGYGSPSFEKSVRNAEEIYSLFQRNFAAGTMVEWKPPIIVDDEAFNAATRFFTLRADAPNETDLAFGDGVDATGRLETMKGRALLHLNDNKITYLKRTIDAVTRKATYEETSPGVFRLGDLVEMEAYFVAFRRQDNSVKMTIRFQGLTLLDASYSKVAIHSTYCYN